MLVCDNLDKKASTMMRGLYINRFHDIAVLVSLPNSMLWPGCLFNSLLGALPGSLPAPAGVAKRNVMPSLNRHNDHLSMAIPDTNLHVINGLMWSFWKKGSERLENLSDYYDSVDAISLKP